MYNNEENETVPVWNWIREKEIRAKKVSIDNLRFAVDWLGEYETDENEVAQALTNAMGFLLKEINRREKK